MQGPRSIRRKLFGWFPTHTDGLQELLCKAHAMVGHDGGEQSSDCWNLAERYTKLQQVFSQIEERLQPLQDSGRLTGTTVRQTQEELLTIARLASEDRSLLKHRARVRSGSASSPACLEYSRRILSLFDAQTHANSSLQIQLHYLDGAREATPMRRRILASSFGAIAICTSATVSLGLAFSYGAMITAKEQDAFGNAYADAPLFEAHANEGRAVPGASSLREYVSRGLIQDGSRDSLDELLSSCPEDLPEDKRKHFAASFALFLLGDTGKTLYGTSQISAYQTLALGLIWKEAILDSGVVGAGAMRLPMISDYERELLGYDPGDAPEAETHPLVLDLLHLADLARQRDDVVSKEIDLGQAYMFTYTAHVARKHLLISLGLSRPDVDDLDSPDRTLKTDFGRMLFRFNAAQIKAVEDALVFRGLGRELFRLNPLHANLLETERAIIKLDQHVVEYHLDTGDLRANLMGVLRAIDAHCVRELQGSSEPTTTRLTAEALRVQAWNILFGDTALRDYPGRFKEALDKNEVRGSFGRWNDALHRPEFFPFSVIDGKVVFDRTRDSRIRDDPEETSSRLASATATFGAAKAMILPP